MNSNYNALNLNVTPTNDHRQWFMMIEEVAQGYGVDYFTILKHFERHSEELRPNIERGTTICHTPGGPQEKTVIYREGVIKLGFFIRSKQAAAFRQWATDVIVDHMNTTGRTMDDVFKAINQIGGRIDSLNETVSEQTLKLGEQRDEIDELRAMIEGVMGKDEEKKLRALIQEVKREKGMDGRAIVGHVKKTLGVSTPYERATLARAMNVLNNMLGRGVTTVK